jgi:quercetin dioxygenase-like cupin family protein
MRAAAVPTIGPVEVLDVVERDAIAIGLAAGLRRSVDELADGVVRRWWRLVATETFDAWLIDWPEGTSVPRHDHDGAAASLCVVRGRLVETRFGPTGATFHTLQPGEVRRVAADASHEIANVATDPATSVHVYSPPLTAMGFYDPDGGPVRHDRVDPAPALWSVELP